MKPFRFIHVIAAGCVIAGASGRPFAQQQAIDPTWTSEFNVEAADWTFVGRSPYFVLENGKVVNHGGSWLAGVGGATYGLMLPGLPLMRARYYQEVAPRVAMDRAEIVSLTETVKTPAGVFANCLKTEETSQLDPKTREYKYYAPGVGLVKDDTLLLVKYGKAAS